MNVVYDLYQGKRFIRRDTLRLLSQYTTLSPSTLTGFSQPAYLEKTKDSETATRLIKVGDNNA